MGSYIVEVGIGFIVVNSVVFIDMIRVLTLREQPPVKDIKDIALYETKILECQLGKTGRFTINGLSKGSKWSTTEIEVVKGISVKPKGSLSLQDFIGRYPAVYLQLSKLAPDVVSNMVGTANLGSHQILAARFLFNDDGKETSVYRKLHHPSLEEKIYFEKAHIDYEDTGAVFLSDKMTYKRSQRVLSRFGVTLKERTEQDVGNYRLNRLCYRPGSKLYLGLHRNTGQVYTCNAMSSCPRWVSRKMYPLILHYSFFGGSLLGAVFTYGLANC